MLGYRSHDAILTICQNNKAKSIDIVDINETAASLIGYQPRDLAGRLLAAIIPMRVATSLIDYVDYEGGDSDVGAVLSRIQSFSLLTHDKKEKTFRLKVVRGESTADSVTFRLVLQDALDVRKDHAIYEALQHSFKGHEVLHPALGVPNRVSLEKDIDFVIHYHHKAGLRASLVVLRLDHLSALTRQYGAEQTQLMMKHVIAHCRSNLRPSDVVGVVEDTMLGMILLDATGDSARMVANRLRWQVAAHPFALPDTSPLNLSASVAYATIDGTKPGAALITDCSQPIADLSENSANQLLLIA